MSKIVHELRSQPAMWRKALALSDAAGGLLPAAGERIALFGCGTSLYMAQAIASYREAAGAGESDAFSPSEMPRSRRYDRYVALSRSGTTTEVIDAMDDLGPDSMVAITTDPASPVGVRAEAVLDFGFADEASVVQTRFATSAVALWRARLGHDVETLAASCADVIEAPLPDEILTASQFVFLGHGPGVGLASEAALKVREAAGAWTEAYAAMELRHGPMSGLGPHSLVWSLGSLDGALGHDILATGARIAGGREDPLVELVRVQRAAVELAGMRGRDPDHPVHLERSVVLSRSSGDR